MVIRKIGLFVSHPFGPNPFFPYQITVTTFFLKCQVCIFRLFRAKSHNAQGWYLCPNAIQNKHLQTKRNFRKFENKLSAHHPTDPPPTTRKLGPKRCVPVGGGCAFCIGNFRRFNKEANSLTSNNFHFLKRGRGPNDQKQKTRQGPQYL